MKKRIRYYQRRGWTVVVLAQDDHALSPYYSARQWCEQNVNKEEWAAGLYGMESASRFAFKNEADATAFSLRWLNG